ncbi:MAG: HAD family phosphatase [Sedimentisphaerales bacterium]|nr:HAD family phosphatase [Sedimentisphaerales bacterium]
MLRAVIFDFDGVITDTDVLHFRAFNEILASYGIKFTLRDYYREWLGLNDLDLFKMLVSKGQLKVDLQEIDGLIKKKNHLFEELAKTEGRIIDGVRDFLELLRQNNIAIAIYSGSLLSEIELILEEGRLRDYFEQIVSAEQVKVGKPDPEGFLLVLERLNQTRDDAVTADQCVVIEDAHWGIEAAKAARMHTVAITNSYDADQLTMADKTIEHLDELSISDLQELCA